MVVGYENNRQFEKQEVVMNNNNSRFDEILDILKDISERQELTEQIIESYFDILFRRLSEIELELKHITDLLTK